MVPSAWVALERLPLTPNGKLDRNALPQPAGVASDGEGSDSAPQTDIEQTLAALWAEVLGLPQVGVHDNFFALGGDSILSLQIVARTAQAGLQITPKQLFEHPTITELARVARRGPTVTAEQGPVTGSLPLTPIQRWFFAGEPVEPQHFNQSVLLSVPADLDAEHLRLAIAALLAHHDALRMRFVRGDDGVLDTGGGRAERGGVAGGGGSRQDV